MKGAFHLKGAGDRGATIISIVVVLQEVPGVETCKSLTAGIVILVLSSKSNVLTTRTTLQLSRSTPQLALTRKK